jgi:PLP dependent protein
MTNISNNVVTIKKLIADYEQKYHRDRGSVQLLAVSKHQSIEKMNEAFQAGITAFGENYLQEALPKLAAFADKPIEWHFIGPIQSNKTRKIAEHFAWVHSVDSMKIAQRLNDQRPAHLPLLNICIEVNISHEASKSGVKENELKSLASYCLTLPRIKLRGLMTIPAPHDNAIEQRNEFHKLVSLFHALNKLGIALDTLSMGMSEDFEAAIAEGSTLVRIGTAIFGNRDLIIP